MRIAAWRRMPQGAASRRPTQLTHHGAWDRRARAPRLRIARGFAHGALRGRIARTGQSGGPESRACSGSSSSRRSTSRSVPVRSIARAVAGRGTRFASQGRATLASSRARNELARVRLTRRVSTSSQTESGPRWYETVASVIGSQRGASHGRSERIGCRGSVHQSHDRVRTKVHRDPGGMRAEPAAEVPPGPTGDHGTQLRGRDDDLRHLHDVAVGQALEAGVANGELLGGVQPIGQATVPGLHLAEEPAVGGVGVEVQHHSIVAPRLVSLRPSDPRRRDRDRMCARAPVARLGSGRDRVGEEYAAPPR